MGTSIRPEISAKDKYWFEKHRYYELKHFCLQYPIWKKAYVSLEGLSHRPDDLARFVQYGVGDPTARCAISRAFYSDRIEMVERTAYEADPYLGSYILRAVTEELSYTYLQSNLDIPCCKETYYNMYRRFFWLLNKARD